MSDKRSNHDSSCQTVCQINPQHLLFKQALHLSTSFPSSNPTSSSSLSAVAAGRCDDTTPCLPPILSFSFVCLVIVIVMILPIHIPFAS